MSENEESLRKTITEYEKTLKRLRTANISLQMNLEGLQTEEKELQARVALLDRFSVQTDSDSGEDATMQDTERLSNDNVLSKLSAESAKIQRQIELKRDILEERSVEGKAYNQEIRDLKAQVTKLNEAIAERS